MELIEHIELEPDELRYVRLGKTCRRSLCVDILGLRADFRKEEKSAYVVTSVEQPSERFELRNPPECLTLAAVALG